MLVGSISCNVFASVVKLYLLVPVVVCLLVLTIVRMLVLLVLGVYSSIGRNKQSTNCLQKLC